ncbi:MAG: VOC family protein [Crocinitomicaceae bacterium]|nr:VOC family protein [Flavobacteriales bacterium]NQZ35637.1 VOC family protein [Crocinitomicaceae bacterium]
MATNNHINYIEFKAKDLGDIKKFYSTVFGWKFTDYGETYVSFEERGITGGFEYSDQPIVNGALVVLFHDELEEIQQKVETAGGTINIPIFSFPGGKRFHFIDPSGNELAIWTN